MDDFAVCDQCGEAMYNDCMGDPRCEQCDPPCPHCYDGGMEAFSSDDEEDYYDGDSDWWEDTTWQDNDWIDMDTQSKGNWWDNQDWEFSDREGDIPY